MDSNGRKIPNTFLGDVLIVEGDLELTNGDHIIAGDIEVKQIEVEQINLKPPNTSISFTADIDLNDNKILNTTEITSSTQVNMPQPLDMVGNGIYGVAEVRGFSGNSLLLNTFSDGSGLIIEEGGEIQAEKPLNLLSNSISGVSSLTIDGNAKNTIIDNDFNTLDAGSANLFNVDTGGAHDFTVNNQQKFTITNTQLEVRTKLNMFGANQIQCTNFTTDISSNLNFLIDGETLNFRRFGGGLDIGWSDGDIVFDTNNLDMDNNTIKNLTIEQKVVYVPDGSFPTSFTSGYTYILIGTRTITTQVNLTGFDNITFKGLSRETSEIILNVPGIPAILTVDSNISFTDLKIRNTTNDTILIQGTNASKIKILSITNCEFRNCRNGIDITGYELVDFLNNIFIHFQGGSTIGSIGLKFTGVAKLQITSCEVVKWFEEGQPANTNPFAGNMIEIYGGNGATNISSGVIHPRVNQNGVYLDAAATWVEFCLNSNAFIDIGLTGGKVLETNSNTSYETVGVVESNSLIPNLKSRLGAQLSECYSCRYKCWFFTYCF
jgi:hypothetical protein